jgi:hypothetical protein
LSLTSRLLGMIVARTSATVTSITLTPSYVTLRRILIEELRGAPEIGARIAARLRAIEQADADAILAQAAPVTPPAIEHRPEAPHAG